MDNAERTNTSADLNAELAKAEASARQKAANARMRAEAARAAMVCADAAEAAALQAANASAEARRAKEAAVAKEAAAIQELTDAEAAKIARHMRHKEAKERRKQEETLWQRRKDEAAEIVLRQKQEDEDLVRQDRVRAAIEYERRKRAEVLQEEEEELRRAERVHAVLECERLKQEEADRHRRERERKEREIEAHKRRVRAVAAERLRVAQDQAARKRREVELSVKMAGERRREERAAELKALCERTEARWREQEQAEKLRMTEALSEDEKRRRGDLLFKKSLDDARRALLERRELQCEVVIARAEAERLTALREAAKSQAKVEALEKAALAKIAKEEERKCRRQEQRRKERVRKAKEIADRALVLAAKNERRMRKALDDQEQREALVETSRRETKHAIETLTQELAIEEAELHREREALQRRAAKKVHSMFKEGMNAKSSKGRNREVSCVVSDGNFETHSRSNDSDSESEAGDAEADKLIASDGGHQGHLDSEIDGSDSALDKRSGSIESKEEEIQDEAGSALRFAVGERVQGLFDGGDEWFAGKVTKAHIDGRYDIIYDDGDEEVKVEPRLVRAEPSDGKEARVAASVAVVSVADVKEDNSAALSSSTALEVAVKESCNNFAVGDLVEVRDESGEDWDPGTVTGLSEDGIPEVRKDGHASAYTWTYYQHQNGGVSENRNPSDDSAVSAVVTKDNGKYFAVGVVVEVRDDSIEDWEPGTVTGLDEDGTPEVRKDGYETAYTWTYCRNPLQATPNCGMGETGGSLCYISTGAAKSDAVIKEQPAETAHSPTSVTSVFAGAYSGLCVLVGDTATSSDGSILSSDESNEAPSPPPHMIPDAFTSPAATPRWKAHPTHTLDNEEEWGSAHGGFGKGGKVIPGRRGSSTSSVAGATVPAPSTCKPSSKWVVISQNNMRLVVQAQLSRLEEALKKAEENIEEARAEKKTIRVKKYMKEAEALKTDIQKARENLEKKGGQARMEGRYVAKGPTTVSISTPAMPPTLARTRRTGAMTLVRAATRVANCEVSAAAKKTGQLASAAAENTSALTSAEASTARSLVGVVKYVVGDRVEVRDEHGDDWELGIVAELDEDAAPVVRKDGYESAYTWRYCRRFDEETVGGTESKEPPRTTRDRHIDKTPANRAAPQNRWGGFFGRKKSS